MYTRISNSMMTSTFIRDLQRNLSAQYDLQRQISTGKKVQYASDDPIAADRILDYRQTIEKTTQYTKNINDGDSISSHIDLVTANIEDVLLRARDLAVKASNEAPNNQQAIDAIAAELDSLLGELVNQANQSFDGKYLFSGYKSGTIPFTAETSLDFVYGSGAVAANGATALSMPSYTIDGTTRQSEAITDANSVKAIYVNGVALNPADYAVDPATNTINITDVGAAGLNNGDKIEIQFDKVVSVKYTGDSGTREIEISDGSRVGVSYAGAVSNNSGQSSVFGKYSSSALETQSVEAFQKIMDLRDSIYKYTNTGSSNIQDISRGITDIDDIRTNVTTVRAEQGGRANRLELALNRHASVELFTKEMKKNREEVDMAEAISQLVSVQTVYQAALGAGASIIQTTLLDFLR